MTKRKYREEEREKLKRPSPKNKRRENEHRPKIRPEYMDFTEERPRKASSQDESGDALDWFIAGAFAVIILAVFVELI